MLLLAVSAVPHLGLQAMLTWPFRVLDRIDIDERGRPEKVFMEYLIE